MSHFGNHRFILRRSTLVAALATAALAVTFASGAQANLLVDGSFEGDATHAPDNQSYGYGSPAIPGWTVQGKLGLYNVQWLANGFTSELTAYDGRGFIDLTGNPDYGPAGMFQTFATTAGTTYRATFQLGYGPSSSGFGGPVTMTVSTGGSSPNDSENKQVYTVGTGSETNTGTVWTQFTYDFTATALTTLLRFDGESAHNFMGLDGVDVEVGQPAAPGPIGGPGAIPEPASIALLGLGLVGGAFVRRRAKPARG